MRIAICIYNTNNRSMSLSYPILKQIKSNSMSTNESLVHVCAYCGAETEDDSEQPCCSECENTTTYWWDWAEQHAKLELRVWEGKAPPNTMGQLAHGVKFGMPAWVLAYWRKA
jgi:hypothetical protein